MEQSYETYAIGQYNMRLVQATKQLLPAAIKHNKRHTFFHLHHNVSLFVFVVVFVVFVSMVQYEFLR